MENKVNVGIIGCGSISGPYMEGCRDFDVLNIVSCADLVSEKALRLADEYGIPNPCSIEDLLNDPEIQVVLNLTPPRAHDAINRASILAGKHTYSEKPLGITRSEGSRAISAAKHAGVRLGCAPDTFLGSAFQTCRLLLDEGQIGEPVAVTAFMISHGWEHWHPAPHFYYQIGGGPMLDTGPYYITTLVSLLGPIKQVTGLSRITFPERRITSEPYSGEAVQVETPTHIAGIMEFENGTICTLITSFDLWTNNSSLLEIYGTEGSISLPDPGMYGGALKIIRRDSKNWEEIQHTHSYHPEKFCRGIGVADFASALSSGRPHRANDDLAYHVLDVMLAFNESSKSEKHIRIASRCDRPDPIPKGLNGRELEE